MLISIDSNPDIDIIVNAEIRMENNRLTATVKMVSIINIVLIEL